MTPGPLLYIPVFKVCLCTGFTEVGKFFCLWSVPTVAAVAALPVVPLGAPVVVDHPGFASHQPVVWNGLLV